jgi:hypothetical protein
MPSESTIEQIAAAIETRLSAIAAGSTYFYTPEKVARCAFFDEAWLTGLGGPVYLIRNSGSTVAEANTGQMDLSPAFSVLVAVQGTNETFNPFALQDAEATGAATQLDRAVRDVLVSLVSDPTMGGLAVNVLSGEGASVGEPFIVGRWVCSWITFTAHALALKGTL